jgi:DNA-binding NarL/FixJ family response regulator
MEEMEEHRPEIVVLDLQMQRMDGVQAARLIKHRWPQVRVVAISLNATDRAAAITAGADAFVTKGESPERLLAALDAGRDS